MSSIISNSPTTPRGRPPLAASKQAKAKVPTSIYLRDIRDLSIHGGIDSMGNLVMVPIFSGLGTSGVKAGDYLKSSEDFWLGGLLGTILAEINYLPAKPQLYRVDYPSLTSGLPLPSPATIDHILAEETTTGNLRKKIDKQLARCISHPTKRSFRMVGEDLSNRPDAILSLLDAEAITPGLLTEGFRQTLEAIQSLQSAIDGAENEGRFVIANMEELGFAQNLFAYQQLRTSFGAVGPRWSSYVKSIQEGNAALRLAIGDHSRRITSGGKAEFTKLLLTDFLPDRWGVVADPGFAAISEFVMTVSKCSVATAIESLNSPHLGRSSDWVGGSDRFMAWEKIKPTPAKDALAFAWSTVLARGVKKGLYKKEAQALPDLAQALDRRYAADSALAALVDHLPSRPLAEGGALIVRTDVKRSASTEASSASILDEPTVRVEPAISKPHVAAARKATIKKAYPRLSDQYTGLTTYLSSVDADTTQPMSLLHSDAQENILWPHGRMWQGIALLRTLAGRPDLFLCPEVLTTGSLQVPVDEWNETNSTGSDTPPQLLSDISWGTIYDYLFGVVPWLAIPDLPKNKSSYDLGSHSSWPIATVDGGCSLPEVRVAVQFVQAGSTGSDGTLASLGLLIRDLIAAADRRGEESNHLDELLTRLGQELRFEARPYFDIDGQQIDEAQWFAASETKGGYFRLACGIAIDSATYLAKTDQFILRQRVYAKFRDLKLRDIWTVQRQALAATSGRLAPDEYLRQLSLHITPVLKELDNQALGPIAKNLLRRGMDDLAKVVRSYQSQGLAWVYLRLHLGYGVCLADEMGLGKTLQAIALLRAMRDRTLPSLVVMPKTLLHNWKRELTTYAGPLSFAIHGEDDPKKTVDLWLVSYPRLRIDQAFLSEREWNLVVLDEAHAIKNTDTQVTEAANQLKARYRLALTGTPVENRAAELWSIINWLNPGYLGNKTDFSGYTTLARSSEEKVSLLAPLRECLSPLILRRLKSDPEVALGLPEKVHIDLPYELSDEQFTLYESVIETVLAEKSAGRTAFSLRAIFLKAILHLKQICIHPDLFYGEQDEEAIIADLDLATKSALSQIKKSVIKRMRQRSKASTFEGWMARSGKLSAARDLIESLRLQSSGILIFTQYLGAAEILKRALSHGSGGQTPFIHGGLSSSERMGLVDEFNESCRLKRQGAACPILILSIKAGGTGLNLTGADRVLHFDRWWNPAVEDQATDRAHRIGQQRTVFAHTLTGQGTIEESIAQLFVEKRQLAADLLGAAASDDVGTMLRSHEGFLDLVDPVRTFTRRLIDPANLS